MRLGDILRGLQASQYYGGGMTAPMPYYGAGGGGAMPVIGGAYDYNPGGGDMTMPAGGSEQERLRQGIIATAQALNIDPIDLATVISYETGGTFDPTQPGPTTQWGRHRGLIQFGEPQAQQYGVDWNDPLGSQLGPNGAIARYLLDNGFQPGMGLLDLYSTINAGAPGRYNASDANNGGAPGTVADKVNEQMGGHRENAVQLLGDLAAAGNYGPPMPGPANAFAGLMPGMMPPGAMPPGPPPIMPALRPMQQDPAAFMRPVNALAAFQPII